MRRLYWYAMLVVLTHGAVVFWHLELLAKLNPALKVDQVPLFAGLANIVPLLALILLWSHYPKLGGSLLLFLAVPLVIGGYSHFLSPGSDNVFRMAPGEWTAGFRISAVLLAALECCACALGIEILRRSSSRSVPGSSSLNAGTSQCGTEEAIFRFFLWKHQ
ncbi:MAG: hypothetical protein WBX16_08515 [Candidatus Acidiferrales bacterium]